MYQYPLPLTELPVADDADDVVEVAEAVVLVAQSLANLQLDVDVDADVVTTVVAVVVTFEVEVAVVSATVVVAPLFYHGTVSYSLTNDNAGSMRGSEDGRNMSLLTLTG